MGLTVRELNVPGLSKDDKEVVRLLAGLGLDERSAKVLAFLARVPESESAEIERKCRMRQPEVSLATKLLRTRGWVRARERRKGGKGRPAHVYQLQVPFSTVLDALEAAKREEWEAQLMQIRQLRALAAGNRANGHAVTVEPLARDT